MDVEVGHGQTLRLQSGDHVFMDTSQTVNCTTHMSVREGKYMILNSECTSLGLVNEYKQTETLVCDPSVELNLGFNNFFHYQMK